MTERAIYLSTHDDRMVFVIPWRDFSLVGTDGKTYRLADLKGRNVVLAWFPKAFTTG